MPYFKSYKYCFFIEAHKHQNFSSLHLKEYPIEYCNF
uniref:Uncharacterized protein n=1 Tax=Arundo donax TaxID=35708 RepID=A0A0A8Y338_ARUDO